MEKKYTAREAAIEVLKKAEELLKNWHKKINKAESSDKTASQVNEFKGIPQEKPKTGTVAKPPRPLKTFLAKKEAKRKAKDGQK